jgi:hypothetical protein
MTIVAHDVCFFGVVFKKFILSAFLLVRFANLYEWQVPDNRLPFMVSPDHGQMSYLAPAGAAAGVPVAAGAAGAAVGILLAAV